MAALNNTDRVSIGGDFQSDTSHAREPFGALTKNDIQAAVSAIDDWCVANQASFNAALPQPARAELTLAQKTSLFMRVVRRRFERGV